MRITDNMAMSAVLQGNARSTQRLSKAAREASTGERVGAPSDDPVAWTAAHGHDARIARMETRAQTTSRAAGDLELAESTLASVGDMIQQARELALTTANGAVDAQTRSNVAAQVSQIRDAVLGQMNTRGASGYLFGGTRTDRAPFDAAGTFSGNDTPVSVEVADGVTARANASGARAFTTAGTGGRDILADLQSLATALTSNNLPAIRTSLDALDAGRRQVTDASVETGLASERLRSVAEVTDNALIRTRDARAREVEVDLPSALTELTIARGAYERGVSVTRELLQTTTVGKF